MEDAAREHVTQQIDRLLRECPPADVEPAEFWGAQFDLGLAWVHFPLGRGGLDVDPDLQDLVDSRLRDVDAPSNRMVNFMGLGMAGPTIVRHGTEPQKEQLLRPMFTCEEIWCQLFSEPGAGSDLAGLSTSAVRDGDQWVINGQKVWTTLAHVARWGMLLARTDPDAKKHAGLTYFLIDMGQESVDVRPLRQMTGEAEFNEVYFTDAIVDDRMRVGDEGQGWKVGMTTLMTERSALGGLANQSRGSGAIRHAVNAWHEQTHKDPATRDRLVKLWIDNEMTRLTARRAQEQRDRESPGPEGAIGKIQMTETSQLTFELANELRGLDGLLIEHYDMVRPTIMSEDLLSDEDAGVDLTRAMLSSRASTIGGGTSQIGRNVIAERVLGMPGDIRVDKDLPWRDVPRS